MKKTANTIAIALLAVLAFACLFAEPDESLGTALWLTLFLGSKSAAALAIFALTRITKKSI